LKKVILIVLFEKIIREKGNKKRDKKEKEMQRTVTAEEKEILARDERYVLHGLSPKPIIITEGVGSHVKDITGRQYLDLEGQTSGPIVIGHKHPKYMQALKDQMDKITHSMTAFVNIPRVELAEKLAMHAPGRLQNNCMTYFSCGGSEASEIAIRFAMLRKRKYEVISVYHGYHGRTLALVSLIGQSWRKWGQIPRFPGFHQIPNAYCYRCYFGKTYPDCNFECAWSLEHCIRYAAGKDNVAAFIIEPIQGNGGHMFPPSKRYWEIVREICDKYGVLLIVDEIQTGVGRTGRFWGCDHFGIDPDILLSGKALGGGMPISATMIHSDLVTDEFRKGEWCIFSMAGSPLACKAASTTIDIVLEEKLPERARSLGKRMMERLKTMQQKHSLIGDVRGAGVFIGVELVKDRTTKEPAVAEAEWIVAKALEKRLLLAVSHMSGYGNVIKMKPCLTITDEEVDKALDIFEEVLSEVEQQKFQ